MREEIAGLEADIYRLAGEEFLIASPQQLGEILFEKLGLSRKRRGKTGFSTDARVLQAIRDEHEIVPKIERWRELSTLIKTYLDVLPAMVDERSRIHTTFLQAVAQTGRLSSTNPNMQNVPIRTPLGREIRGCFEAQEGNVLICADYSQIELRVLAHVADEPVLKEIFERGEDVHTATASQVFGVAGDEIDPGMRSKAKMINYGIVYGLSDFGLADRLNIPREEAKEFIDAYLERFPRVAAFIAETIERAKEEGYVTTLWGRRRQIPELRARNYQMRTLGERLAVNTVIQGTAADIIKLAMVRCARALVEAGLRDAPAPDDPRRAAVRGAAAARPRGARADRARDDRRLGARPAAGRRHRRRRQLAGGQVSGVLRASSDEPRAGGSAGVVAGCLVGLQAPVNSRLGKAVGTVQAASVSFLVGTVALVAIAAFVNGGLGHDRSAPATRPGGRSSAGLLGAVYVTVALVAVRTLGAAGLTAAVITGQLAISVLIDRFGLLGVAKQPVSAPRIVGLVLLVVGVAARRASLRRAQLCERSCSTRYARLGTERPVFPRARSDYAPSVVRSFGEQRRSALPDGSRGVPSITPKPRQTGEHQDRHLHGESSRDSAGAGGEVLHHGERTRNARSAPGQSASGLHFCVAVTGTPPIAGVHDARRSQEYPLASFATAVALSASGTLTEHAPVIGAPAASRRDSRRPDRRPSR